MGLSRSCYGILWVGAGAAGAMFLMGSIGLVGCSSPLGARDGEDLRWTIAESVRRETRAAAAAGGGVRTLSRSASTLTFPAERMAELEALGGSSSYRDEPLSLTDDLLGRESETVRIGLAQAIGTSVRNNLGVQFAELTPAINQASVVAAEAAFDWVFFADFDWTLQDEPGVVPVVNGARVGAGGRQGQSVAYETGVRRALTSGGTVSLSQGQTYADDSSPGIENSPDPSNAAFLSLGLAQPLLRGFGSDVSLAEIRLARNTERDSILALKSRLLETVTETERAYWDLVGARARLKIQRRLLERGIEVRDVLDRRRQFDVRQSEFAAAVATVEQRRGNVILAENALRQASDRLKALMNDSALTVGNEVLLLPVEEAVDRAIEYSLLDVMTTALEQRPEVQRALLRMDDASIRVTLADNARLPMLDLSARATLRGLDEDTGDAYGQIGDSEYLAWLVGLQFEQPIGNRAAEAGFRQAQLRRVQEAVGYREAVQDVVLSVVTALREVKTAYDLIEQSRSSRLAATENLRALLVQEETIATLSPEFLDLKFRRQEALAQAEINEVDARLAYATAIATLHGSMGTALERSGVKFVVPDAGE